jgi:competence/damage-inducible protein CinA-like protein
MRPIANAEIIAVGSELLTASRLDTNSLAITERLRALGIALRAKAVVGDRASDLSAVFRGALGRADLIVLTGGLGPTDDDLTRDVVASELGLELIEDAGITDAIRQRFARRGLVMPEINRRQAMVPRGAVVLPNPNGTAPGLWVEAGDRVVVLLPGPPRELIPMLEGPVTAALAQRTPGTVLYTRTLRIFGRSESHTEEAVRPLYGEWAQASPPIDVTILAARGAIDLLLSINASSAEAAAEILTGAAQRAAAILGDDVYSTDGEPIELVVGRLLKDRRWRLAAAESCTGGLVLKRLTDFAGSSDYVEGGVVSYSNAMKISILGVESQVIDAEGAVSETVALQMAGGIRRITGAEVGIGVTGIAGPGGGSELKPVGTVMIAVEMPDVRVVRTKRYTGGRDLVRDLASHAALDMVRRLLMGRPIP